MAYQIETRKVPAQDVMSIRVQCHVAELGAILAEILPEVWRYCRKSGVAPSGPPFTRYHAFDNEKVDIEGGLPVSKPLPAEGRITPGKLPEGEVATTCTWDRTTGSPMRTMRCTCGCASIAAIPRDRSGKCT